MLKLNLPEGRNQFAPGESIEVQLEWQLQHPQPVTLRLYWITRGKGSTDSQTEYSQPIRSSHASDNRRLSLRLPPSPYSFSGRLVSLVWMLELSSHEGDEKTEVEIVIAPGKREIVLFAEDEPPLRR